MKTAAIVIGAIIFAGGIGFIVMNNNNESEPSNNTEETVQQTETESEPATQPEATFEDNPDPNNYTDGANIGSTVDATDQSEVTISADEFLFDATFLKIKKGTKVTWVNNGNIEHDVTSDDNSPKSGLGSPLLSSGDTYEFTFDEAGIYEYFCTPHFTQMRGVITVVE